MRFRCSTDRSNRGQKDGGEEGGPQRRFLDVVTLDTWSEKMNDIKEYIDFKSEDANVGKSIDCIYLDFFIVIIIIDISLQMK